MRGLPAFYDDSLSGYHHLAIWLSSSDDSVGGYHRLSVVIIIHFVVINRRGSQSEKILASLTHDIVHQPPSVSHISNFFVNICRIFTHSKKNGTIHGENIYADNCAIMCKNLLNICIYCLLLQHFLS